MAIGWFPISQARKDGTRYILLDLKTPQGVYTGSWKLRWGIINGKKMQVEAWWLDGFDSPSNPTAFTFIPMIPINQPELRGD